MKQNILLKLSYDGVRYKGWEHQKNETLTIQGKLELLLYRMLIKEKYGDEVIKKLQDRLKDITGSFEEQALKEIDFKIPTVIGAGRTDAGVSAKEMTANVIIDTEMSLDEIQDYMNLYLPDDIAVLSIKRVKDNFHSRFMAKAKTYRYCCYYGRVKPVFDRKYVSCLTKEVDIELMKKAAESLIGKHDFKSFCGNPHMKKSTVRTIDSIIIEKEGPYIYFTYHGDGFLQNMVRIMTGTLLDIGRGLIDVEEIKDILEACDRKKAGHTAPPNGLMLINVEY